MEALKLTKESILKIIDDFPPNIIVKDFIDRIVIAAKIEKGLEQFDSGEYLTSEELDEEMKSW